MANIYYITNGRFNYFQSASYDECVREAESMQAHDKELEAMYLSKYGYIPSGVDIHPEGYHITSGRFNG